MTPVDAELRKLIATLPDPKEYAASLTHRQYELLMTAVSTSKGLRLDAAEAILNLRNIGLCEFGGRYLTNFGAAVHAALAKGR